MTRTLQAGFETGETTQIGTDNAAGTSAVVSLVTAAPVARSGTYCLKCTGTGSATLWNSQIARKTVAHATATELWYSFGFWHHHVGATTARTVVFFVAYDASGFANVVLTVDAGTVRASYATAGGGAPTAAQSTLIGTASASLSTDAWHHLDVRIVAATGATGVLEVWQDGVQVINATSQRTAQIAANLASFALLFTSMQSSNGQISAGSYHAFDDLRVNDTTGSRNTGRSGDESILLLLPTGAGDSTQLARGGADSGANWSQVDELPPNGTTDYVSSDTVGQADLYNLSTIAATAFSCVEVIIQGFNSGGGGSVNLVLKTGAGQSDGSAQALTATPTIYKRLVEADPTSGLPFSQVDIDALQVGIKVASMLAVAYLTCFHALPALM